MAYMICTGHCIGCGRMFNFNPYRVPSVRVDGVREPCCRQCVEMANSLRLEKGMEPFAIPDDAYEAEECL